MDTTRGPQPRYLQDVLRFPHMALWVGVVVAAAGCGRLGLQLTADTDAAQDGDVLDASGDAAAEAATDAGADAATDAGADSAVDAGPECVVDSDCDGRGLCPFAVCTAGACMPGPTGPEICDGLDNDCSGAADDAVSGGNLCAAGQICADAACVDLPAQFDCRTFQLGDHVYGHCGLRKTWPEARAVCAAWGAHLVTVSGEQENMLLQQVADEQGGQVWTGYYRESPECTWQWVTGEPVTFEDWGVDPADGSPLPDQVCGGADCVQMWRADTYRWDDTGCGTAKPFLCEWEPGAVPCVPSPEICDGQDNDCDLQVDEAADLASLCASGEACVGGACQTLDPSLDCQAFQSGSIVFARCGLPSDFVTAHLRCASIGAVLASATTPERDQVLRDFTIATGQDAWVGLFRESPECTWQWVNGEPVTYTNWGTNEFGDPLPDNMCGVRDCVQLWRGTAHQWDDASCDSEQAFLCEWANP